MIMPANRLALPTPEPPLQQGVSLQVDGLTCALQSCFRTAGGVPGYVFDMSDESGTHVGEATLLIAGDSSTVHDSGHLGIKIDPEHRGKGFTERIAQASLPVFKQHGLNHVRVVTAAKNLGVVKMLRKLDGMPDEAAADGGLIGFTILLP